MENKKQLVIVPPMSEPLQKLNEVLQGIAADENMEISIIDDMKELSQFLGSAGQCLVSFSNAKKCATFLQENRFVLAKSHSKVILLTPKEIPAKTLIKFTKIGLTESILENSPPKTLLYKVKLLLRSIKTAVAQDQKDQVVKSMLDTNQMTSAKGDDEVKSLEAEEEQGVNYLAEERAKFKKNQDEEAIDYGDPLKGKNTMQEEAIDTHWKSKRKLDENEIKEEGAKTTDKLDSDNIDMYYRGKKKGNSVELVDGEDLYARPTKPEDEEEEIVAKKKKIFVEETEEDLREKKSKALPEEEDLEYKQSKTTLDLEPGEEEERPKLPLTEEEIQAAKKKEFDELEELFAAARKRQAEAAEDLGGHLKGKISNFEEEEEEPEIEDKKEYDNSDLYQKEKSTELDLISEDVDRGPLSNDEEDDEKDPHEGEVDHIDNKLRSDNGSTDKINTRMMSEMSEDASKKITTNDIFDREKNKDEEEQTDEDDRAKTELDLIEATDADFNKKKTQEEEDSSDDDRANNKLDLIENAERDLNKKNQENQEDKGDNLYARPTKLELIDGDADSAKPDREKEQDPNMAYRKGNQTDLDLDKDKERGPHSGKVDKIDTYYRSGESKKVNHSWDNLTDKNNNIDLGIEKTKRADEASGPHKASKDAGEITIDYRKLKEEFEHMSRGGTGEEGAADEARGAGGLYDSEDEGTFKVVELDARGFDFSIEIINLLYQKDSKPVDFYQLIASELINKYHGHSVFYNFKISDKKHVEVFNSFQFFNDPVTSLELKEWWAQHKKEDAFFSDYDSKTMSTWLCRDIPSKDQATDKCWEDVELPSWAANELTDKKVELVFPYFDGVDRMGMAVVFFPFGLNPKMEKAIMVTLEMARTIQLDMIQRKAVTNNREEENTNAPEAGEKKNILSAIGGLFNRKKAS